MMLLRSRLTRVFPRLFCRSISVSRALEISPTSSSSSSSVLLSTSESSSEGESGSEAEDGEANGAAPQVHQIQVLRAYLRNRRSRCLNRVREQGRVPAVLVDPDRERRPKDGSTDVFLSLDAKPLVALLKLIGKRDFVSRIFDMDIYRSPSSSEIKESVQVLPRNLNYGPGKTNILNAQFVRALPGQDLKLGVPLEYLGIDRCPGLKKGGTLKKLAKYVLYRCKAAELPAKIVVDMSVLEIGDRVRVQDLEVDFNHLESDRTMVVCEIVKDVSSLKAKARRLKNELLYKKKALAETECSVQAHPLSDDEIEASDDSEDEVIPYRFQKQRALAKKGESIKKVRAKTVLTDSGEETLTHSRKDSQRANPKAFRAVESKMSTKPSKRRLTGTSFGSSREKKLDQQGEQGNVLMNTKKHKAVKVSDTDDDGALLSLARNEGSTKNRGTGERSGHEGQGEQHRPSSSQKFHKVLGDSDSGDEDGVVHSHHTKRRAHKALESRVDSDSEDDDQAFKRHTMKACVSRRGFGIRAQKEHQRLLTSSASEVDGEALPSSMRKRTGTLKRTRREVGV